MSFINNYTVAILGIVLIVLVARFLRHRELLTSYEAEAEYYRGLAAVTQVPVEALADSEDTLS